MGGESSSVWIILKLNLLSISIEDVLEKLLKGVCTVFIVYESKQ